MKTLEKQIKGDHYIKFRIQPAEFINKNNLLWAEANVIKYVCRHKKSYTLPGNDNRKRL